MSENAYQNLPRNWHPVTTNAQKNKRKFRTRRYTDFVYRPPFFMWPPRGVRFTNSQTIFLILLNLRTTRNGRFHDFFKWFFNSRTKSHKSVGIHGIHEHFFQILIFSFSRIHERHWGALHQRQWNSVWIFLVLTRFSRETQWGARSKLLWVRNFYEDDYWIRFGKIMTFSIFMVSWFSSASPIVSDKSGTIYHSKYSIKILPSKFRAKIKTKW